MNRVMLMGRALKKASIRWVSDRTAAAEFPMIVERSAKTASGAEKLVRLEVTVQAYGNLAERLDGAPIDVGLVYVEGRLRIEDARDEAGRKLARFSVVAERVELDGAEVRLSRPIGATVAAA
jgi:single-stranded DNA-binding protein